MIEIDNLRVDRGGKTICAVERLTIASGEHVAIVGPNGSGKTTLLRVLAGLTDDFSGQCAIAVGCRERTYVHQQPFLFRGTALANARYAEPNGAGETPDALAWLERLGIAELADQSAHHLSGGESRRVALARALAYRPQLLLVDEPLADLDSVASEIVCHALNDLSETTVVVASPMQIPEQLAARTFALSRLLTLDS